MKIIITVSLAIGLLCAVIAPFVGNLYVYRIASGYSGKHFWLSFSSEPNEEVFLDAVIYRDPLIANKYETTQAWRKAQQEGTRLCIKRDNTSSIVIAPYDATKNPDTVFLAPIDATKTSPTPRETNIFDQLDPSGSNQKMVEAGIGRIKGVWLTEPATRTKFPVALVGFVYFIGALIASMIAAFSALAFIRWFWYFLLRRISELSGAVRRDK